MNKYIILFTVICSLTICNADALTKAAVIDFYGEGISGSTLIVLSDYLRSELMRTGLYDLMDRRYMSQILEEQAFQYSGACTDLGCIVDMGKMLGVTKMFGGTIGKLGAKYMITVKIVDVSTGRIENMITEKHMGAEEDLDLSITQIALKLAGTGEEIAETSIYVKSEPSGAQISLDGENMGFTPIEIPIEEIKEYSLRINLQNYKDWNEKVTPQQGKVTVVNAILSEIISEGAETPIIRSNLASNLIEYNKNRKSAGAAFFLSIFPGGGHFYSKYSGLGAIFFTARLASYIAINNQQSEVHINQAKIIAYSLTGLDMIGATGSAKEYNTKLKQKYNISMHPTLDAEGNTQMAFTIDF